MYNILYLGMDNWQIIVDNKMDEIFGVWRKQRKECEGFGSFCIIKEFFFLLFKKSKDT